MIDPSGLLERFLPGRSPLMRWSLMGVAGGVLLGVVIALVVTFSGGGDDEVDIVVTPVSSREATPAAARPATATPALDATPDATSTPTPTPTPTATPEGDDEASTPSPPATPTVNSLRDLHATYGEAPDATLGRIRIPVLGVDAPVGQRYVGPKMPNPTGPGDVVWYDLSQWDGLGGVPGGGGNAVFSGHVDYNFPISWAEAHYRGEGVFYDLRLISPGDVIEVEVGSAVHRYQVVWQRSLRAADASSDWAQVLSGDVDVDSITLITCGGDFNAATKSYSDRLVVRAERLVGSALSQ